MPLFEIAMVQKLTKKEQDETGATEKIVLEPVFVLAKDDKTAGLMAMTKSPPGLDLNRTDVLIRPFA